MPDAAGGRTRRLRWARLSLRLRVTIVAAVAITAGSVAAVLLLVLSLRSGLVTGLDDAARARASEAVVALERGDAPAAVPKAEGDSLVQVLDTGGRVVAASPGLTGRAALVRLPTPPGPHQQPDRHVDGRDLRVFTQTTGSGQVVVVASSLEEVEQSLEQLARRVLVGGPVLLGLLAWAVWLLVGYTLGTVERLREQVAQLSATGLDHRVEVPEARDEVRQLAVTMNDLLDRMHRAALAQRRFVADAAHELRSPLAALRTRLEVSERAADLESWQRAAPVLVSDAQRLADLVDGLLALARLDESPQLRRAVAVDLDEVVFAEVARLRGPSAVVLDTRRVGAALLHGDPDLLRRVVANLLDNAVRHAASRVEVAVRTCGDEVELTVADDGPGIPPAELERVFERFHRLDGSRDRDAGGSGLGLAIVRDAVRVHRGSVRLDDALPGVRATVLLPLVPAAAAGPPARAGSPVPR